MNPELLRIILEDAQQCKEGKELLNHIYIDDYGLWSIYQMTAKSDLFFKMFELLPKEEKNKIYELLKNFQRVVLNEDDYLDLTEVEGGES